MRTFESNDMRNFSLLSYQYCNFFVIKFTSMNKNKFETMLEGWLNGGEVVVDWWLSCTVDTQCFYGT